MRSANPRRGVPAPWIGPLVVVLFVAGTLLTPGALARSVPLSPTVSSGGGSADPSLLEPAGPSSSALGYDPALLATLSAVVQVPASQPINLTVSLAPRDPGYLSELASGVSAPGSPYYGKFLTPAEFGATFGPPPGTYRSLLGSLEGAGFRVTEQYADHLFLGLEGTVGAADQFFHTTLVEGTAAGSPVLLPASPPVLPTSLAPTVAAVSGLSAGTHTFQTLSQPLGPLSDAGVARPGQGTLSPIGPNDPHTIYGLNDLYNITSPSVYASGTTIGILLWGLGFSPGDLQAFSNQIYPSNEPAFNYTAYPLYGAPAPSANAVNDPGHGSFELTLDMEWSVSQAPGAHLEVVYVPEGPAPSYSPSTTDLLNALSYLVNTLNPDVLTMSFGSPDTPGTSYQSQADSLFEQAAVQGMSVFAASGDDGGQGGTLSSACSGTVDTMYPASSPWVTGVGGTQPTIGPLGTLVNEVAWKDSGGGFSVTYATPTWQEQGSAYQEIQQYAPGHRGVPDVAAAAADNVLYFNGQVTQGEGTSFASPMWAGLTAEMDAVGGHRMGFLNPRLYVLGTAQDRGFSPAPFREITQGSNCVYSAQAGWNPVTGWGSPNNALQLYADLTDHFANIVMTPTPSNGQPGGTLTVSLRVYNGSQPLANVPVNVTFFSSPSGLRTTTVLAKETVRSNATGVASASYPIPLAFLSDRILVEADIYTPSMVGSNTTLVDVTLLGGYLTFLAPLLTYPASILFFALIMTGAAALGYVLGLRRRRSRAPRSAQAPGGPGLGTPAGFAVPGPASVGRSPPPPTSGPSTPPPEPSPPAPSAGPPVAPPPVEERATPGQLEGGMAGTEPAPSTTEGSRPLPGPSTAPETLPSPSSETQPPPGPPVPPAGASPPPEPVVGTEEVPVPCWSCGRLVPASADHCPFCEVPLH